MSARQLRALAALYEPPANEFEEGRIAGLLEAADIVDGISTQLDALAVQLKEAALEFGSGPVFVGKIQAFREAARLVRGDEP